MIHFSVPEMTCGHCKKTVEEALNTLDANASVSVDLDKHEIGVSTAASAAEIMSSLKTAGYEATQI